MNTKAKGTRLEHKSMKWLEEGKGHLKGRKYRCTRAAASLGEWDIIAISSLVTGTEDIKLVQVKANRRPRSKEMEALNAFKCPVNCSREIWIWKDRARKPVIEILGGNNDDEQHSSNGVCELKE